MSTKSQRWKKRLLSLILMFVVCFSLCIFAIAADNETIGLYSSISDNSDDSSSDINSSVSPSDPSSDSSSSDIYVGANTLGDVNADGKIETYDASLILQYVAKLRDDSGLNLSLADTDGDGSITSYDAMLILQYIAKTISSFPAKG